MVVLPSSVISAINRQRVVELRYEGDATVRVVHPHILYRTSTGNEVFDAYQVSGPTHSGQLPGWRPFDLGKVLAFTERAEEFSIAPGYNPSAPKYRHGIVAHVR
jgi:hypothetical protein